jgi:predicted PolB exonuclease-like 3'-5' exonuclease
MNTSVIVWDLETVPDLRGFATANGLTGKADEEVRAALGDKFPKHIYHSIVCIGALVAHREDDHWAVDALGAPHVGERSEKELIAAFVAKIAELNPQLVTFNGNSFDLPVSFSSVARATLNEISRIMGLTGKPDGMDGSEVEKYYKEGKIKEIAEYCESDVVNTYRVWLRYELFRGRLTEATHQTSELSLIEFVQRRAGVKPHLSDLVAGAEHLSTLAAR